MQRQRLNLILGIVVLGLGLAVFLSQEKDEKGPPLTSLTPEQVTQVVLQHPDSPAIRLQKQDGQWRLVEPVQGEVDGFEINSLLSLSELETQEQLDPAAVSLKDLSLDPAQYTVTLNDTTIEMGGVEPLNFRRYAKVGDAIYLVEDPPSAALDNNWADLVAKRLLPEAVEIQAVTVPGLRVFRAEDGQWRAEPATERATPEALGQFIDAWKNARSMWNEQAATPPSGMTGELRIKLPEGERVFRIAQREPQFKLYAPEQKVLYVLSKTLETELLQLPEPAKDDGQAEGQKQKPGEPDAEKKN